MPRRIAPQLADISQDIAGELPLSTVLEWSMGDKTTKRHQQVLEPFLITGTTVSSDSAGLSRLSREKTLLEVMKLVNDPKVLIVEYGKAIGGKPIGIWAADNTEMFYPQEVSVTEVVEAMAAAQRKIKSLPVQVGLGIHHGTFIHIGGGLFGKEADYIEDLAENYTEGGDIMLTHTAHAKLTPALQKFAQKSVVEELKATAYKILHDGPFDHIKRSADVNYPIPFSDDFFALIRGKAGEISETNPVYKRYTKDKVVILVKVKHRRHRFLLDQFAHWIMANAILEKDATAHGIERIKSNGSLGIFVSDDPGLAVHFAKDVSERLTERGYPAAIGLAKGEVLIFPLSDGGKDIAGNPVNVASKLAEDVDTDGKIWIEQSAVDGTSEGKAFTVPVSHITLSGRILKEEHFMKAEG